MLTGEKTSMASKIPGTMKAKEILDFAKKVNIIMCSHMYPKSCMRFMKLRKESTIAQIICN
jgi:hypothetical protein